MTRFHGFRRSNHFGSWLGVAAVLVTWSCGAENPIPPQTLDAGVDGETDDSSIEVDASNRPPQVIPLASPAPDDWTDEELAPLGELLGDHTIVGLGEATHVTHEVVQAKRRVFRYLVEQKGFRLLAWEASHGGTARVDAALQTCTEPLSTTILDLTHVAWLNEDVRDTLQDICDWNLAHPSDTVHLFGFDLWNPWAERDDVMSVLREISMTESDAINAQLQSCPGLNEFATWDDWSRSGRQLAATNEQINACRDGVEALEAFVVAHDVEIGEMLAGLEAVHFDQARALLRGWYDYMLASASPRWSESFQVRDGLLAQTFLAIHGAYPSGTKVALWAAQSHLARNLGESVFFDSNGDFANAGEPYVVLGQRIDEAHHEEYFPIGFSALDMRAMRGLTNTVVTSPSDTGSLDAVVANMGLSAGVLDLDRPSSEYDAISPTEQYGILQNSMLVPMYPGHQFGAFVSLAVSGAATYFPL